MSQESTSSIDPNDLPSKQTVQGLNGLLFFISDDRHGVGPLLSVYLHSDLNWNPTKIGLALASIDFSAVISQLPAGMLYHSRKINL